MGTFMGMHEVVLATQKIIIFIYMSKVYLRLTT